MLNTEGKGFNHGENVLMATRGVIQSICRVDFMYNRIDNVKLASKVMLVLCRYGCVIAAGSPAPEKKLWKMVKKKMFGLDDGDNDQT